MQDLRCTHLSPFHEDLGSTSDGPFMSMTWLLCPMTHRPFTTITYEGIIELWTHNEARRTEEVPVHEGALHWIISLGRFDAATAVMTMSRFRVEPREGHLERVKRSHGYLRSFMDSGIRVRTDLPDRSGIEYEQHDWVYTVYGNCEEQLPEDIPPALGKPVDITTHVDANLFHDLITDRAVTGILHMLYGTPV